MVVRFFAGVSFLLALVLIPAVVRVEDYDANAATTVVAVASPSHSGVLVESSVHRPGSIVGLWEKNASSDVGLWTWDYGLRLVILCAYRLVRQLCVPGTDKRGDPARLEGI